MEEEASRLLVDTLGEAQCVDSIFSLLSLKLARRHSQALCQTRPVRVLTLAIGPPLIEGVMPHRRRPPAATGQGSGGRRPVQAAL